MEMSGNLWECAGELLSNAATYRKSTRNVTVLKVAQRPLTSTCQVLSGQFRDWHNPLDRPSQMPYNMCIKVEGGISQKSQKVKN